MERSAVLSTHNNPQIQYAPCLWVQSYPPVSCGRLSFRRFVSYLYCCVRASCWAFPSKYHWKDKLWLRMCGEPCERSSPYLSGISARCSHTQGCFPYCEIGEYQVVCFLVLDIKRKDLVGNGQEWNDGFHVCFLPFDADFLCAICITDDMLRFEPLHIYTSQTSKGTEKK